MKRKLRKSPDMLDPISANSEGSVLGGTLELARKLAVPAVVLASVLVMVLATEVRQQQEREREARRQLSLLHEGYLVPSLVAVTDAGGEVQLGAPPDGRFQLLFLYSEPCEFSRASAPAWGHLTAQVRSARLPVESIALLVDDPETALPSEFDRWAPPGDLVQLPDARSRYLFRTGLVRQVALIDSSGRVIYHRSGVLDLDTVQDSVLARLASLTGPIGEI